MTELDKSGANFDDLQGEAPSTDGLTPGQWHSLGVAELLAAVRHARSAAELTRLTEELHLLTGGQGATVEEHRLALSLPDPSEHQDEDLTTPDGAVGVKSPKS